MLNSQWL